MDTGDLSHGSAAIVTEAQFAQLFRKHLQSEGILDRRYRMQKLSDGTVALPVLGQGITTQLLQQLKEKIPPGKICVLSWIQNPIPSKAMKVQSPIKKLHDELKRLLLMHGASWSENLEQDLPHSWQRHGDLVLLSEDCFKAALWGKLGPNLWKVVAGALGAQRLAKQGHVQSDLFRSPTVMLLLGEDGWVEHVDNRIRYAFDVTRCMLSAGNITEKLRVATLQCTGEVVVDLYAGIGYFTLPYLIHAGAAFVHACEWNPHAVEALQKNLRLNGVQDQCCIHIGDNKKLQLKDVADRVNLGLIPTSEEGWPVACQVLRKDVGGVLHIHQNVESFPNKVPVLLSHLAQAPSVDQFPRQVVPKEQEDKGVQGDSSLLQDAAAGTWITSVPREWQRWAEATGRRIRTLLQELDGKEWWTKILHIEQVKSYAPHIHHLVLDLDCRPVASPLLKAEPTAGVSLEQ